MQKKNAIFHPGWRSAAPLASCRVWRQQYGCRWSYWIGWRTRHNTDWLPQWFRHLTTFCRASPSHQSHKLNRIFFYELRKTTDAKGESWFNSELLNFFAGCGLACKPTRGQQAMRCLTFDFFFPTGEQLEISIPLEDGLIITTYWGSYYTMCLWFHCDSEIDPWPQRKDHDHHQLRIW